MAYGDSYYALNPVDGKWYTTDQNGRQLYTTPLPVGQDGKPIDPATGNALGWNVTSFQSNSNASAPDPLSAVTSAQQNPVTSQTPQSTKGSSTVRVGPGQSVSVGPATVSPSVTTVQPSSPGTNATPYQVDQNRTFVPGETTLINNQRYVAWPDGGFPSEQSAKGYLYQLRQTAPDQYAAIVDRMAKAGWDVSSPSQVQKVWEDVVGKSADAYQSGYKGLDPFTAIDLYSDNKGARDLATIKVTDVNNLVKKLTISSPSEVKSVLSNASQALLGRDPSSKELAIFTRALNSLQQQTPEYAKTTGTTTEVPGTVSAGPEVAGQPSIVARQTSADNLTTVTTGGLDQQQYATDWAKSRPDYAEYQAATTYMDALLNAIQSPVNI